MSPAGAQLAGRLVNNSAMGLAEAVEMIALSLKQFVLLVVRILRCRLSLSVGDRCIAGSASSGSASIADTN